MECDVSAHPLHNVDLYLYGTLKDKLKVNGVQLLIETI